MDNKKSGQFRKAKEYCFRLLESRPRSESELYSKLKNKEFDEKIINTTLKVLKSGRFIDDEDFARAWIESRIKKPLALRSLRRELRLKGIDARIIERSIARIKENYSEEAVVSEIIKQKLSKSESLDPQKKKRHIYGYLLRRGFSPDIITDAIEQISP